MSNIRERSLELHRKTKGKLGFYSKIPVQIAEDLSLAYSSIIMNLFIILDFQR